MPLFLLESGREAQTILSNFQIWPPSPHIGWKSVNKIPAPMVGPTHPCCHPLILARQVASQISIWHQQLCFHPLYFSYLRSTSVPCNQEDDLLGITVLAGDAHQFIYRRKRLKRNNILYISISSNFLVTYFSSLEDCVTECFRGIGRQRGLWEESIQV